MAIFRAAVAFAFVVCALTSAHAATARPKIAILTTGGTIAAQSNAGGGYTSARLGAEQLLATVPQLGEVAEISLTSIAQVGSQDMTSAIWLKLAREIELLAKSGVVTGVVIAHGTDTLEETAFFLEAVRTYDLPVVLTGATRPADAPGADGPRNLYDSVRVAASSASKGRGVLAVFDGKIHGARWVQKVDLASANVFASPTGGPVGYVEELEVRFVRSLCRTGPGPLQLPKSEQLPRVPIVYAHADLELDFAAGYWTGKPAGLILAGVGNGNVAAGVLKALKVEATRIPVVRSTRVPAGFVERNIEVNDDESHFAASLDINPQKARILLQLLLAQGTKGIADVQAAFGGHRF